MGYRYRKQFMIEDSEIVPAEYEPSASEQELLECISLSDKDGKLQRQIVSCRGIEVGLIQIGHGFGESYVVKATNGKAEKLHKPKDYMLLRLLELI